jgi:Tfp pilus assembly protein PilN
VARRRIYAVDVGTSRVKVAEVVSIPAGLRVSRVGIMDVDPANGRDGTLRALRDAMSHASVRRGSCVVSLPRAQLVTRRLANLPARIGDTELAEVVRLQAQTELPFEPGRAIYDFYDVRRADTGTSVELVAAKREDVDELLALVRHAGGNPTIVAPSVLGIAVLARVHQKAQGIQRKLLILNVGASSTDVVVMRGSFLAFSRSFPVGTDLLQNRPDVGTEQFRTELTRTVQAYRRDLIGDAQEALDEVWFWGGGATAVFGEAYGERRLMELAQEALGTPAVVWSSVDGFHDASVLEDVKFGWARFGVAIGLAAGALDGTLEVNLLPHAEKERKAQSQTARRLLAYAAASVVGVGGLTYIARGLHSRLETQHAALDLELARYQPLQAKAAQVVSDMRAMARLREPRHSVLDILRELTALLPNRVEVGVTGLNIERSGKITVNLEANSHDTISQAVTRIGRSAWFRDVRPGQIIVQERQGKQVRQVAVAFLLAEDSDLLAARGVGTDVEPGPPVAEGSAPGGGSGGPGDRSGRARRAGQSGPARSAGAGAFAPGAVEGSGARGAARRFEPPADRPPTGERRSPREGASSTEGAVRAAKEDEEAAEAVAVPLERPPAVERAGRAGSDDAAADDAAAEDGGGDVIRR